MGNNISYQEKPCEVSLGKRGAIQGLQFDNKSRRFAGVRYALPPTNEHRWRKPQPLPESFIYASEDGQAFDATKFGAVCPQKAFHVVDAEGGAGKFSEDCLLVNIWTPVPKEGQKDEKWPVMLWLHGGWFQMGDPSHEPGMNPTEMISTGGLNAIVVSIGYRLNLFGFLAGRDVLEDNAGVAGGNFGLWDQRLAAEWVKENIEHFGGDPENITLAGRSAGAYSAEAQMLYEFRGADKRSSQLYRRIFMDSNAIPAQPKSLADVQEQFDELCGYFQVDKGLSSSQKLDALREKSALELVKATSQLKHHTFRPVTDDLFFHSGMVEYLNNSPIADEFIRRGWRILIGEVRNEESLYSTYNGPREPTLESLRMQVANYYAPEVADRVIKRYDLPNSTRLKDWRNLFGRIIADGQVRAPSRTLVDNLSANGVPIRDIWRYHIAYRLSFITEKVAPMSFGVAHAMDKPFWNFAICHGPSEQEQRLMQNWIDNLVAFVRDDQTYEFGTKDIKEMKVVTPNGTIEVQQDERWADLVELGKAFAGSAV